MTIELARFDGLKDEVIRNGLFQEMTMDTTGACNDMISMTLGEEGQRRVNHVIIEPVHIRIKETVDGGKLLQIEAESGVTLARFRSGMFPEMDFKSEYSRGNKESPITL